MNSIVMSAIYDNAWKNLDVIAIQHIQTRLPPLQRAPFVGVLGHFIANANEKDGVFSFIKYINVESNPWVMGGIVRIIL